MASSAMTASSSPVEHLARGVVRRVQQDQPRAPAHRRPQLVDVEPVPAVLVRLQEHGHRPGAGQRDARLVAVVHRLEDDDLVAVVEHAEQGTGQRLGRAGRDEDLGVRVVLEAVEALLVAGDGVPQHGQARAGRVLVDAAADGLDGGVEHLVRAVGVREALAEVDRAGGHGQRGHLGEDRRAEPAQLGRQHVTVAARIVVARHDAAS